MSLFFFPFGRKSQVQQLSLEKKKKVQKQLNHCNLQRNKALAFATCSLSLGDVLTYYFLGVQHFHILGAM